MWSYTYYFLNYEKFFAEAPLAEAPLAEAPLAILEITYFFKSLTGAPLSQAPLSQAHLAIFWSSYVFGWGSFGRGSFGQAPLTRLLWHRLLQLPVSSFLIIFCSKNKIQTKVGRKSKKSVVDFICWLFCLVRQLVAFVFQNWKLGNEKQILKL